jgi:hypothetical protein
VAAPLTALALPFSDRTWVVGAAGIVSGALVVGTIGCD